jgi:adenylate kinase family enzyme
LAVLRVCIIGASGSGKTTLGAQLAARMGAPHVELDALHHGPEWSEPGAEEFRRIVEPLLEQESWVIDGAYWHKLGEMVPAAADTVIWIDLPLRVTISRLLVRTFDRLWNRRELWNGNRESLRGAFWGKESLFWWAVQKHREYRRTLPALFAGPQYAGTRVERLRSSGDVDRLLAGAGAG